MIPQFPKCRAETTFEIPSSTTFGEKRKVSLQDDCEKIYNLVKDNLVRETQVSNLEASVSVQIKEKKIENYKIMGSGSRITNAEKVAIVFKDFDSYSNSNLVLRFCKGFLLTLKKKPVHIKREKDTFVANS